jgi:hypothetical protein
MTSAGVLLPFFRRATHRDDVLRRLAGVKNAGRVPLDAASWARRLRTTMEDLGQTFALFAAYLGSRIDVLPLKDCVELAGAGSQGAPLSQSALEEVLNRELPGVLDRFVELDATPVRRTATAEIRRGRLVDDSRVQVEILTVPFDQLAHDVDLLPLAGAVLDGRMSEAAIRSVLDDFVTITRRAHDLRGRILTSVSACSQKADRAALLMAMPRPDLCSAHVLISDIPEQASPLEDPASLASDHASQLGRPLLAAWLQQALFGGLYPVVTLGERPLLTGFQMVVTGDVARLCPGAQCALTSQFLAVAAEMPDKAWASLRSELCASDSAASDDEMQRAFRRLVPFRDDPDGGSGSSLADSIFMQWRLATESGWLPSPQLASFYRGMFGLVMAVCPSMHHRDLLAESAADLEMAANLRQFEVTIDGAQLMMQMERQMALLLDLPQKVDRLLTAAAEGNMRVHFLAPAAARQTAPPPCSPALAVLLVFAAGGLIVGSYIPGGEAPGFQPWFVPAVGLAGVLTWIVVRRFR